MNMTEIRKIADQQGIHAGKMKKLDLVRAIQRSENNWDCFATARDGECDQVNCSWREDCFTLAQKTHMDS